MTCTRLSKTDWKTAFQWLKEGYIPKEGSIWRKGKDVHKSKSSNFYYCSPEHVEKNEEKAKEYLETFSSQATDYDGLPWWNEKVY